MRARLSLVGGDGAVAKGGPQARHSSTKAAELTWRAVHPRGMCCTEWDKFHRVANGIMRAMRACPAAEETLDLAAAADSLFGMGEGRALFGAVAEEINEECRRISMPGGTRKVVYLSGVPGNLLFNYKTISAGIHARIKMKEQGRGKQTKGAIVAIGRRLSSLDFVAFATLFDDILSQFVRPLAKVVQSNLLEMAIISKAEDRFFRGIR